MLLMVAGLYDIHRHRECYIESLPMSSTSDYIYRCGESVGWYAFHVVTIPILSLSQDIVWSLVSRSSS